MKLDLMEDFGTLAEVTGLCKQDYANYNFFKSLNDRISLHFSKLALDYARLLLIDVQSILSTSENDKCTFWKFLSKLESGKHDDCVKEQDIVRWKKMLSKHSSTIENIKFQRDKEIAHINGAVKTKYDISMHEVGKLLLSMEEIILDMCIVFKYDLTYLATTKETCNHSILEAFRQIDFEAYCAKLLLETN